MKKVRKVISAAEAVAYIQDGDTLVVEGSGGGVLEPSALLTALEQRFLTSGGPTALTLVTTTGIGDKKRTGMGYLAHVPLLKRVITGNLGQSPKLAALVLENKLEAYNFPQGQMAQLMREIAGGRPGVITKVGLHTFLDPRQDGGKLNDCTTEELLELVTVRGESYILYPAFPINVCFIRGTTADEQGNITLEEEPARLEVIAMAQATHNSGGIVIAQVKYLAQAGSLRGRDVVVPSIYVDHVVVDENQRQLDEYYYNASLAGNTRAPLDSLPRLPLSPRKVIARRALMQFPLDSVVNLGVGMSSGAAAIAAEEGLLDRYIMTVEQGIVGGMPAFTDSFGTAFNHHAMIDQPYQFDFYDGGGLDVTCLAFAQIDAMGNVNVSKFSGTLIGTGGFVNISQNTPIVVFCGTMTAGGLEVTIQDGQLTIIKEGKFRKFLKHVEHITFNGQYATEQKQEVYYITERAVFKAVAGGIQLIEIAPGIDLQRDVLSQMDFIPQIADPLPLMEPRLFAEVLAYSPDTSPSAEHAPIQP